MADAATEPKVSYPYLSSGQWFGVRTKLRQSVPTVVDVDWIMAALGGSEKGAQNLLPQLKNVGLLTNDGKPVSALVHDLRDDASYPEACKQIVEKVYPTALREAWHDPDANPDSVAAWFMRNAGTGAQTAKMQARFYLLLLSGALPSPEQTARASAKKATPAKKAPAKKVTPGKAIPTPPQDVVEVHREQRGHVPPPPPPHGANAVGPNLHIDLQIHIASDASDAQIETVFKSMAKYLYGRE